LFEEVDQGRVLGDLTTFFGPRAGTYLKVYEKMRAGAARNRIFPMTWSWPVFFGAFIWFFYRRMYLMGAVLILVPIVLSLLAGPSAGGGGMVVFAIGAKTVYVQTALSRILKADAQGLAGAERSDYLRRAGGVSLVAGVLAGLLYAAFFGLAILGIYADPESTR
jgi:hypothetical protein